MRSGVGELRREVSGQARTRGEWASKDKRWVGKQGQDVGGWARMRSGVGEPGREVGG